MSPATDTPAQPAWLRWTVAGLASAMVVACILWNVEAHTRLGIALLRQQYMALQLGLALCIAFLLYSPFGKRVGRPNLVDAGIAVLCLGTLLYAAIDFVWLLKEQFYRPWQITLIGTVVVLAVMEGIRRRAGVMLFSIVGVFLVYALFADKVPGQLIGRAMSPQRLVDYVGFDSSAVFSSPLAVGTVIENAVTVETALPANTDGMTADNAGNIYMTALLLDGVMRFDEATGAVTRFAHHPEMNWPDTMTWGPDGSLYVVSNHLHVWVDGEMNSEDPEIPNFRIWRIPNVGQPYFAE